MRLGVHGQIAQTLILNQEDPPCVQAYGSMAQFRPRRVPGACMTTGMGRVGAKSSGVMLARKVMTSSSFAFVG